jgi:hypothetical protein
MVEQLVGAAVFAPADPPRESSFAFWSGDAQTSAACSCPGSELVADGQAEADGDRQLRLGHDGRWYPFLRRAGGWDPAGPPHADPGRLFDADTEQS